MEEILDSDDFDLLSSSQPRFVATPTVSDPSTVSDIESIPSDSLSSTPSDRELPGEGQNHDSLPSSIFASDTASETTSLALSDHPNPHLDSDDEQSDWSMDMDGSVLPNYHRDDYSESTEESLFVNDFEGGNDMERDSEADYFDFAGMDQDDAENQIDELVGMEVEESHNPQDQRHQRNQLRAEPEVIDLTGDSPPQPHRNARRLRSQRNSPPRLARSDASYVNERTVIDLISDSDDEIEAVVMPPLRHNDRSRPPRRPYNIPPLQDVSYLDRLDQHDPRGVPGLPMLDNHQAFQQIQRYLNNTPLFRLLNNSQGLRDDDDLMVVSHRNILPADNALPEGLRPPVPEELHPPAFPPVHLDYNIHPFQHMPHVHGGATPKPTHDPPKETRQGFTRNTADDVVAICPSCEQELAYEDGDDGGSGTTGRRARSKKDKAEHHFWAVKACGHVYCRKCFDNRKPVGKNPVPVGFRPDPSGAKNKMLCAVEDCDSEVGPKNVWVGIFM
ncbi:hypothetical protein F4818DRAFT_432948 [Hypoxylon cercidicola]|nr:hypothetical protein F4818DRAFT_432948 [Hypoxylon cercidicola]